MRPRSESTGQWTLAVQTGPDNDFRLHLDGSHGPASAFIASKCFRMTRGSLRLEAGVAKLSRDRPPVRIGSAALSKAEASAEVKVRESMRRKAKSEETDGFAPLLAVQQNGYQEAALRPCRAGTKANTTRCKYPGSCCKTMHELGHHPSPSTPPYFNSCSVLVARKERIARGGSMEELTVGNERNVPAEA